MTNRWVKHRSSLLCGAVAAWAACGVPLAARAAQLSEGEFRGLAARCAPGVAPGTLEGVAKTESGLDPLTLHDNTTGASEHMASAQAAVSEATAWIARGDSVDLGLMQVNSANLASLGMTVAEAFDGCASLAAGAAILRAAYGGGQTPAEQQVALLMALSRYNTGSPFKGILNGYARKVIRNAQDLPASEAKVTAQTLPPAADPNAPPSWDVWASASYAQSHGASWLVPLSPGSAAKPAQADRLAAHGPAAAARSYAVIASTSAPTERSP